MPDDTPQQTQPPAALATPRTEVVTTEQKKTTTQYTDGTVRVDQRLPPAPPPAPAPISVDTTYRYTREDMDRLHSSEGRMRIQVGGPVEVQESEPRSNNNPKGNWLTQSQR
jgi:hypothetical protein